MAMQQASRALSIQELQAGRKQMALRTHRCKADRRDAAAADLSGLNCDGEVDLCHKALHAGEAVQNPSSCLGNKSRS